MLNPEAVQIEGVYWVRVTMGEFWDCGRRKSVIHDLLRHKNKFTSLQASGANLTLKLGKMDFVEAGHGSAVEEVGMTSDGKQKMSYYCLEYDP